QGRRNESGGAERGQVLGLAGGGPHLIAAGLKGIGQGATDAAGTTGDQDDGLGPDMPRAYCCYAGTVNKKGGACSLPPCLQSNRPKVSRLHQERLRSGFSSSGRASSASSNWRCTS